MEETKAKFLSNKRTLLSIPGKLKTDAYYTVEDSTVNVVELTANLGRYISSLSTDQFNGVGQVIIPNSDILGETYLHLQLPFPPGETPETSGSPSSTTWYAPAGWGWHAIKSISYLWGASNVSQITLSGKSLWAIALAQCDTAEKRSQLCYLGGSSLPSNGITNDNEGVERDCYLPLALPWSVMCHAGKKGYDTSLLTSPITIQIQFAPREEFIQWASGASQPLLSLLPTRFTTAEIVVRQMMFSDRSQSLKFDMMNDPSEVYNYPFKHFQSFQKDFKGESGNVSRVQLTGFINADLIGMVVFAVKKSNLIGGGVANGASNLSFNPLDIALPKDVKLYFNGQILYNSPGKLYLLQNCAGLSGSGSYSAPKATGTTAGGQISLSYAPLIRDMIFIDFSRKHSLCFEHEYENVFRIANQTLDLDLTLPDAADYTLYATYVYNGVNATQQGASNLYFD